MDIKIPDSWLREYLDTNATPKQIQEAMSLCGPSIERLEETNGDWVYSVEVTTNRVDTFSVIGLAFEAVAILPRFGYKARLKKDPYVKKVNLNTKSKVNYLRVKVDQNLCQRFSAVLIKNVRIGKSSEAITKRLELVGHRAINNIVDVSNYLMVEMGQPVHVFDWDKIAKHQMVLRESKKGERITTLDSKEHILPGGDIVIEDGSKKLIDLCGIMGGANSAVDEKTKNVLLFVQVYEPTHIRKTSMALAHRTDAAAIFEKGLPTENVLPTLKLGVELISEFAGGKAEKTVLDILNTSEKLTTVKFTEPIDEFVSKRLGIKIGYDEIVKILKTLEIVVKSKTVVEIPWVRKLDITIPEDIVEEVARIYGYHNLPSIIMNGSLPENPPLVSFRLESAIKQILKGYGGVEVYTLSLVSKENTEGAALKLRNPLGGDAEYLRTSLAPSLVSAVKSNSFEQEPFYLFEIANTYIPRKGDLPEEHLTLGGVFANTNYQEAKGIVKSLLEEINVHYMATPEDGKGYMASQRLVYKVDKDQIGEFGTLENGLVYFNFSIEKLWRHFSDISNYKPLPKYPPQIEDLTLIFPEKTKIGEVISSIKKTDSLINKVDLHNTYKETITLRVYYQHSTKTLTDKEVEEVRERVLKMLKEKFGGSVKD